MLYFTPLKSLSSAAIATCLVACSLSFVTKISAEAIDFEDVTLESESAWIGPVPAEEGSEAPGDFGGTVRTGFFESGGVQFVNRRNLDFGDWSGFAVSNRTDNLTAGFTPEPNVFTGTGFGPGADNYAAAFGYVGSLDPTNFQQLEKLPYFDIPDNRGVVNAQFANTTYAALSMLQGDAFAKRFGGETGNDPDFLRLTIYGSDDNAIPLLQSVELFLADYRFEDNSQDFVLDAWTTVDLSPLSEADRIYFNLDSTDVGEFGMNTPAYFAIDDIVLTVEVVFGDVTHDGMVSVEDVDAVCSGIATTSMDAMFDLNGDRTVAGEDVTALLAVADRLPGDANFDGEVQFADFLELAASVGRAATWSHGDFNCNGVAEFTDFLILSENFGRSSEATAVPEPSVAVLLFSGASVLIRRRRTMSRSDL